MTTTTTTFPGDTQVLDLLHADGILLGERGADFDPATDAALVPFVAGCRPGDTLTVELLRQTTVITGLFFAPTLSRHLPQMVSRWDTLGSWTFTPQGGWQAL